MKTTAAALFCLLTTHAALAERQVLFFARETAQDSTRIALSVEDDGQVYGTQTWKPKMEAHGSSGSFDGTLRDGVMRVTHQFTIEGSEQTEEEMLKLDGDRLLIGEGELVEGKDGVLKLKDPASIVFKTALKKVAVSEPKAGSAERKAIMDTMRAALLPRMGKPVTFTGRVRVVGDWARFHGNVATADGKPPKNEEAGYDLELDFFALMKRGKDGGWKVLVSGFAGDISVMEEAREKHPEAPWPIYESLE